MTEPSKLSFEPIPISASSSTSTPATSRTLPGTQPAPRTTFTAQDVLAHAEKLLPPGIAPDPAPQAAPQSNGIIANMIADLLKPTRTKGAMLAGMLSLVGGAYGLNLLVPVPSVATQGEPAIVDAPPQASQPKSLVAAPPLAAAPGPRAAIDLHAHNPIQPVGAVGTNPQIAPLPIPTFAPVPPIAAPAFKPQEPVSLILAELGSPTLPTPVLVPVAAPTAPAPITIPGTLPLVAPLPTEPERQPLVVPATTPIQPAPASPFTEVKPIAAPPVPVPLPVPVAIPAGNDPRFVPTTTPIAVAPIPGTTPPLPLPEPVAPPPAPLTPVIAPVTLPMEALPIPGAIPAIAPITNPIPATPLVEPTPAPIIVPLQVGETAPTPPRAVVGAGTPAPAAVAPRTEFDVDLLTVAPGDSYSSISQKLYDTVEYAAALQSFNRNAPLRNGMQVEVPPLHIIRKVADRGRAPEPQFNTVQPVNRVQPKEEIDWNSPNSKPRGDAPAPRLERYEVPRDGMTFRDVAFAIYGTERDWGKVDNKQNYRYRPDERLRKGTLLFVPVESVNWR